MKNIYVVRHGQTDWNVQEIIQGTKDIPLNDTGRKQAHEVSETLKNVKFDKIISSPLKRAYETAEIVNGGKIKIQIDDRLIERKYGQLEGESQYALSKFNCTPDMLWDYKLNYDKYEIEPINDLLKRVKDLLDELIAQNDYENILLATHNITSIAIKYYFEGKSNKDKFMLIDGMKNCEYRVYKGRANYEQI